MGGWGGGGEISGRGRQKHNYREKVRRGRGVDPPHLTVERHHQTSAVCASLYNIFIIKALMSRRLLSLYCQSHRLSLTVHLLEQICSVV